MTAIAAVLAFSSTPLLAQEADTTTPVVDPAPAPAPTPPAADPLAPDPAPVEAATTTATTSTAKASKPKAATAARTTRSVTRSATTRTVTRSAAPAPAPAAEAPMPAPAATAETAIPPVAPGPMPIADPAPVEPATNTAAIDIEEALPIAGGTALGLMLLGAAAFRRRRRRKQEEADEATKMAFLETAEHEHEAERVEHPVTRAEPALARAAAPRHDPVPGKTPIADAPITELPDEFDLSRFGPHVQAAYRGPTEDNPSLSLKYRLRRASFLDQQERRMAEAAAAKAPEPVPARGNWESRPDADFLFRRAGASEGAKPALQDQ